MRNQDLERCIIEDPDDIDAYLIYADWLLERGVRYASLVRIQRELANDPENEALLGEEARILHESREAIFDDLTPYLDSFALGWRAGFIESAHLHSGASIRDDASACAALGALLSLPSAAFLRSLTIGRVGALELDALVGQLAEHELPVLQRLFLCDSNPARSVLAHPLMHLQTLRTLIVNAVRWTGAERLSLPELRHLGMHAPTPQLVEHALSGAFPNLVRLEVSVAGPEVASLIVECAPPTLQELWISGSGVAEQADRLRERFGEGFVQPGTNQKRMSKALGYLLASDSGKPRLRTSPLSAISDAHTLHTAGLGPYAYEVSMTQDMAVNLHRLELALALPDKRSYRSCHNNRAIFYYIQGDYVRAERVTHQALALWPSDPNLHASLIAVVRYQGRIADAIRHVVESEPFLCQTVEGRTMAIEGLLSYMAADQPTQALELYRRLRESGTEAPVQGYAPPGEDVEQRLHAIVARAHIRLGQRAEAERLLMDASLSQHLEDREPEIIGGDPQRDPRPFVLHAQASYEAGHNPDEARRWLAKLAELQYERLQLERDPTLASLWA